MSVHVADPDETPLSAQFVVRMAGIWERHAQDPDDLAGAMLAWAINQNLATMEPTEVADFLLGIASQLYPQGPAGHA